MHLFLHKKLYSIYLILHVIIYCSEDECFTSTSEISLTKQGPTRKRKIYFYNSNFITHGKSLKIDEIDSEVELEIFYKDKIDDITVSTSEKVISDQKLDSPIINSQINEDADLYSDINTTNSEENNIVDLKKTIQDFICIHNIYNPNKKFDTDLDFLQSMKNTEFMKLNNLLVKNKSLDDISAAVKNIYCGLKEIKDDLKKKFLDVTNSKLDLGKILQKAISLKDNLMLYSNDCFNQTFQLLFIPDLKNLIEMFKPNDIPLVFRDYDPFFNFKSIIKNHIPNYKDLKNLEISHEMLCDKLAFHKIYFYTSKNLQEDFKVFAEIIKSDLQGLKIFESIKIYHNYEKSSEKIENKLSCLENFIELFNLENLNLLLKEMEFSEKDICKGYIMIICVYYDLIESLIVINMIKDINEINDVFDDYGKNLFDFINDCTINTNTIDFFIQYKNFTEINMDHLSFYNECIYLNALISRLLKKLSSVNQKVLDVFNKF